MKALIPILLLAACTTNQPIHRPDGSTESLISCNSQSMSACYAKANKLCPSGYNTLSEYRYFHTQELRIACTAMR